MTAAPPTEVEPCPECKAGKHENCDGEAWDSVNDRPAGCPCAMTGHGENG